MRLTLRIKGLKIGEIEREETDLLKQLMKPEVNEEIAVMKTNFGDIKD